MAEKIVVKAEKRELTGKGHNRRLRSAGRLPVVVYGGGTESFAASVDIKDLAAIIRTEAGVNTVFTLDVNGVGANDVIFQDRQIDPLKGRLIHADLRRFAKGEKIEMTVPLNFVGEPTEQLEEGAMVSQGLREIKLLVEPANAPESIEVDLSRLTLERSIQVSDLKIDAGIEVHETPETVVASIVVIKEADLEPQLEGGEPEVAGTEEPETAE